MTASDIANSALNATLADVQTQIKCCMKLREDDPAALTLSDKITRWVAKDLKLYGGSATSFSPILLSVAAVVWQCAKGSIFQLLPDWSTIADNDPRIKSHLRFHQTVNYSPAPAPPAPLAPSCSVDDEIMVPLTGVIPMIPSAHPATSTEELYSTSAVSDVSDVQDSTTSVGMSGWSGQKRKIKDDDDDVVVVVVVVVEAMEAVVHTGAGKPVQTRKRKFLSDDEDDLPTGTIQQKAVSVKASEAIAPATKEDTGDSNVFWDTTTRLCFRGDFDEVPFMLLDMLRIEALGATTPFRSSEGGIPTAGHAIIITDPSGSDISLPSVISDGTAGLGGDLYDCRWDDPVDNTIVLSSKDLYVSGWDHPIMTDSKIPAISVGSEDPYDCRWDDGSEPPVLPGTSVPMDDLYGCGWDDT
ncbi:hypothetical protein BDR05DRAFT_949544 [Suillus weaverae]|nr:hypothetical protein BDR05DRAFT_949544 [Suillus weaverae]